MSETKTAAEDRARLRSLQSVDLSYRAGDGPARKPEATPATRLTAQYTGKKIRGRPWTRLKRLASESAEQALERIVQLIQCDNDCVALGASKSVLRLADAKPAGTGKGKQRKQKEEKVNVKITLLGKGKGDAQRS